MLKEFYKKYSRVIGRISKLYIVFMVITLIFVKLASEVRENDTLSLDVGILTYINSLANPILDKILIFITNLSGAYGVLITFLILCIYYLRKGENYNFLFILFTIPGTVVINVILKLIFKRVRPDLWVDLVTEKSFSFPSGHAMVSSAVVLSIVVALYNTKYRRISMIMGIIYIILIGFSRMYLGVHYPTDILGGWLVSFAWVMLVTKVMMHNERFSEDVMDSTI